MGDVVRLCHRTMTGTEENFLVLNKDRTFQGNNAPALTTPSLFQRSPEYQFLLNPKSF